LRSALSAWLGRIPLTKLLRAVADISNWPWPSKAKVTGID
jgi:hypothetical protein